MWVLLASKNRRKKWGDGTAGDEERGVQGRAGSRRKKIVVWKKTGKRNMGIWIVGVGPFQV
eukprot:248586-Hanusia_phi.AAC.3